MRISRDEFIEWIKQSFPNNVDIRFIVDGATVNLDRPTLDSIVFTDTDPPISIRSYDPA